MIADVNCKTEKDIYMFLKYIKQEKPEFYIPVKRVLRYIYKIVKEDVFEKDFYRYLSLNKLEISRGVVNAKNMLLKYYVEEEKGILTELTSIVQNNPEYFKYFYSEIEPILEMIESGIYSKYDVHNYIFNLYTMLSFYRINPTDFEGFKSIVQDLSSLFITSILNYREPSTIFSDFPQPNFCDKKEIIDLFLEILEYNDSHRMTEELIKFLNEIHYIYSDALISEYRNAINNLKELYSEVSTLRLNGYEVLSSTINYLEAEMMKNITQSSLTERSDGEILRKGLIRPIFFAPILISGNRFEFFKTALLEIEDNKNIQLDILRYIKKLDSSFFIYLNSKSNQEDSFIASMKIVFDSDTYYEIKSKLKDLIEASDIYKTDENKALQLINELTSIKHKEVIDGIIISWPQDNYVNKVDKPSKIIDRMQEIHRHLGYAIHDFDFVCKKVGINYAVWLESLYDGEQTLNGITAAISETIQKVKEKDDVQTTDTGIDKQVEEEPTKKPKKMEFRFKRNRN